MNGPMPPSEQFQPGLVSIMMPAYNAERFIGAAIESILAQTHADWELIIVNDGSTDGTANVAASYQDERIHLHTQPNSGEAAARNTALSQMRGEFLAFLDADDQWLPDHLHLTHTYLSGHPERAGVYTDGYYIGGKGQRLAKLSAHRRGPFEGDLLEALIRASDVFGPPICVVLRRQVVTAAKLGFDTGIVIGPDWEFTTRVAEWASFGYIDQPTCLYRVHQTNITLTAGSQRRRLSLARCRENAIKLAGFSRCSLATRAYVFYDLLVDLLTGDPERQEAISRWPEFRALPAKERARLFRLMASQAVYHGGRAESIRRWLAEAQALDPGDWRARMVASLYATSPAVCRLVLQAKMGLRRRPAVETPFGSMS